ncbi:MAG: RecQ family ATP-dependent DNA helicase [Bacteroidetes bacterium]|nr:RecQ family ATP-dependent DNA helicase [Bacteroidota bacterium]
MLTNPKEILKKYWNYDSFRPLQEEIIQSVLAGKDTLALLPTGGGKSICFQVPALCQEGLCLVITPLVALMSDQVENLKKRGVPAVEIHSGMHAREIRYAYEKCYDGRAKFLYLSPERIDTSAFKEMSVHLNVSLIAVDEAHCISQWGYDFRPPYLKIAEIRKLFPAAPVLALTATAVSRVVDDIQDRLLFPRRNVFSKSFYRDNLAYVVYKEEDKYRKLLRICNGVKGTGIVYVRNRRITKETAEYLNRNGIRAGYYHAGLDPVIRSSRQKEWMNEKIRVIVATNAFGMGIDKPNVRFVVHLDLPDTLEAYFQEAGRAGRDEKQSYAVTLYNEGDLIDARHFLEMAWPEPQIIRSVYQALGNYLQIAVGSGKDLSFDFDLELFASTYRFKPITVFNVLKILERDGYITLTDAMNSPSRAFFLVGKEALYKFQVENRQSDPIIKVLLRSYSGLFTDFIPVNEYEIARRLASDRESAVEQLISLSKSGILEYVPQSKVPQLIFNCERLAPEDIGLSRTFYFERKKEAAAKLDKLIQYLENKTRCRSIGLLEYFGDSTGKDCGICDICLARKSSSLREDDFGHLEALLLQMLSEGSKNIRDLVHLIPSVSEERIVEVIRVLLDHEKLRIENDMISVA